MSRGEAVSGSVVAGAGCCTSRACLNTWHERDQPRRDVTELSACYVTCFVRSPARGQAGKGSMENSRQIGLTPGLVVFTLVLLTLLPTSVIGLLVQFQEMVAKMRSLMCCARTKPRGEHI